MATMFLRELTLSVVLSRPGTEVLAVQILRFAEDGLWGLLSDNGPCYVSKALKEYLEQEEYNAPA